MYIRCKCKALIPFGNILAKCVKIAILLSRVENSGIKFYVIQYLLL